MSTPDYGPLLGAVGAFSGFDASARSNAWRERLAVNAPELAVFHALAEADGPLYRAPSPSWADALLPHLPEALGGEAALAEAQAIDADCAAGRAPGPLAGVPIAVKDLLEVAGSARSGGSKAIVSTPSMRDAEAIRRLRAAGAVVIGLANLHELAYGITSDNPHFGRVRNPRAPKRIAGGSSGGSAAAVAAGIVPIAIGTDTAGSIRIPAACCGTVGFKPSFDAISRDGCMNLALTLDHVGPLAASVDDAIAAYAVMSGRAPGAQELRESLAGMRIARLGGYFEHPLAGAVAYSLDSACELLARDGARVIRAELPNASITAALQFVTICAEATAEHWHLLHEHADRLGADVRVRLEIGQFVFARDYLKAQRWRARLLRDALPLFDQAELLICPTLRSTAPLAGATAVQLGDSEMPMHTAMTNLTMPFNLLGWPAITMPFGDDANGLPTAVQIIGPPGADDQVLGAARRLESLRRERGGA